MTTLAGLPDKASAPWGPATVFTLEPGNSGILAVSRVFRLYLRVVWPCLTSQGVHNGVPRGCPKGVKSGHFPKTLNGQP